MLSQDDKKFVQAWLAALRSGQYRQTTGVLQDHEAAFCCLGVACMVSQLNLRLDGEHKLFGVTLSSQPEVEELFQRLGLNVNGGTPDGVTYILANLNDNFRLPFKDIADYIEVTFGSEWGL